MNHWLFKSDWFEDIRDGKMEGAEFVAILFCLGTGLSGYQSLLDLGLLPNDIGVLWGLLGGLILIVIGLAVLVFIFTLINFVFASLAVWLADRTNSKSLFRFSCLCGAVAALVALIVITLKTGSLSLAAFVAVPSFMNGFCWALAFYVGAGFLPRRKAA